MAEFRENLTGDAIDETEYARAYVDLVHHGRQLYDGQKTDGGPLSPDQHRELVENLIRAAKIMGAHDSKLPIETLSPETDSTITKAIEIVEQLREEAEHRTYDPRIEVVHVLSGPGTYFDRIKPGQVERQRWMDHDRILAGVAVVREVTAAKVRLETGKMTRANDLSASDILSMGPKLFYNGTPIENDAIQRAIDQGLSAVPPENIVVAKEVHEVDGAEHPIRHTADQVHSLFQLVDTPNSPLHGKKNIAVVSHIPDFVRIPFYLEKVNKERRQQNGEALHFWAYGLKNRRGSSTPGGRADTVGEHLASEFPRLVSYLQRGHLSSHPVKFENLK